MPSAEAVGTDQSAENDGGAGGSRAAERDAIIAAARVVAQRDGVRALTLRRVAAQAGLARKTIGQHFANKSDLLTCAAAEDLSGVAQVMRGVARPKRPLACEDLFTLFSEQADAEVVSVSSPFVKDAPRLLIQVDGESGDSNAGQQLPLDDKRRRQAAELDDIINRLVVPAAQKGEGTAEAIARLERRINVFERALCEMQTRCEQAERAGQDTAKATGERVSGIARKIETLDGRLVRSIAELRAEMRDLAAVQEIEPRRRPEDIAKDRCEKAESADTSTIAEPYLAAARRSAQQAVTHPVKRPRRNHIFSERQLLAVGAAAILVILATLGIAIGEHLFDVDTFAITPAVAAQVPHAAKTSAMPAAMDGLIRRAARGDSRAELVAGLKYLDGAGYAQNFPAAVHWLERAADDGQAVAQYRLGVLYQRGTGVTKNVSLALDWYRAAAIQGNRKAMHNLGVAYAQGNGVARDYRQASQWFMRAAKLGYVDSQFNLAVLHERGQGVPQDLSQAYKWYAIAAANGDVVSRRRVEALATQLSPKQLAAAAHAAARFKPAPLDRLANIPPRLVGG